MQAAHVVNTSSLLRVGLLADGVVSVLAGLLTCAFLGALQLELGAGPTHVLAVGLFMSFYGVVVGMLGLRARLLQWLVQVIIWGNCAWVLTSIAVLLSGWIAPTALGVMLVLVQALAVAVLAALQWTGLRGSAALTGTR